jgi:hypothetical protein
MKKLILILYLIFNNLMFGQNSLNVEVTDDCQLVSGIYNFTNLHNSKNKYSFVTSILGNNVTLFIEFDTIKWILSSSTNPEPGFINTNVTTSLTPPLNGWVNNECTSGTMTINEVLSNIENEFKKVIIYPNPIINSFVLQSKSISEFDYKIFDLTGRNILNGISLENNEINIENIPIGIYLINISTKNGFSENYKIIKK